MFRVLTFLVSLVTLFKVRNMSEQLQEQLNQINQTLSAINDYTNNLAQDLDFVVKQNEELIGKLENGDANVVENLRGINTALTERAESLRSLASRVDQPVPPPATPISVITTPEQTTPVPPEGQGDPRNPQGDPRKNPVTGTPNLPPTQGVNR